jgi:hypothetical protein
MELEGRLDSAVSLPEVLQFIGMNRLTGSLSVTHGEKTVRLGIRLGRVVNSSSVQNPRKLGYLLVTRGLVSRRDVEEAILRHERSVRQRPLGEILVDQGLLTNEQLAQAMHLQVEEEVYDLFALREGSFKFEHSGEQDVGAPVVELDMDRLVMEGARREDEWARIVKNIPSEAAVPSVVPVGGRSDLDLDNLTQDEWRVLSLVNGYSTVESICQRSGAGRFETCRILNSFLAAGIIRLEVEKPPVEPPLAGPPVMMEGMKGESGPAAPRPKASQPGTTSARLMALFSRRREAPEPAASPVAAPPPEPEPTLEYPNAVACVADLTNNLIRRLVSDPHFYTGQADDHLAEQCWRTAVMVCPRADLVTATGNRLETGRFDRFVERAGIDGAFRGSYAETLEATTRCLKMLFVLATQRVGPKTAHDLFSQVFDEWRRRATILLLADFSFDDLAAKVLG